MRSLLRAQLRLALRRAGAAGAHASALLPLLFRAASRAGATCASLGVPAAVAAARRRSSTRAWSLLGWLYVRARRAQRARLRRRSSSSAGDDRERRRRRPGVVAVVVGHRRDAGDRRLRAAVLPHHQRLLRRLAHGRARRLNASAIGGEYLSAASFLGVAGLVLAFGADMLWYPVGWTAGYLVLLVLVAAPLRRSRRLHAARLRRGPAGVAGGARGLARVLVVAIGWLYLMPQFQGAGLTLRAVTGAPPWVGRGRGRGRGAGQRAVRRDAQHHASCRPSSTGSSSPRCWSRPSFLLVRLATATARPADAGRRRRRRLGRCRWAPAAATALYLTYSLIVATFLGTMGLPHVVVRFYTNPDGRAARRTTLVVLALLGIFYLLPPVYGALGRRLRARPGRSGAPTPWCSSCPGGWSAGSGGDLLTALRRPPGRSRRSCPPRRG